MVLFYKVSRWCTADEKVGKLSLGVWTTPPPLFPLVKNITLARGVINALSSSSSYCFSSITLCQGEDFFSPHCCDNLFIAVRAREKVIEIKEGDRVRGADFGPAHNTSPCKMLKQLQMGMRAFLLMASRVWTCVCFLLKKQVRAVSWCQDIKRLFFYYLFSLIRFW